MNINEERIEITVTVDQILKKIDGSLSETERPIEQIRVLTWLRNKLEEGWLPISGLRKSLEKGFLLDLVPRSIAFWMEEIRANDGRFWLRVTNGRQSAIFSDSQIVF